MASKWLQNVDNGRFYPYNEFLAQHYGMIEVVGDPFKTAVVEPEVIAVENAEKHKYTEEVKEVIEEKEVEVIEAQDLVRQLGRKPFKKRVE